MLANLPHRTQEYDDAISFASIILYVYRVGQAAHVLRADAEFNTQGRDARRRIETARRTHTQSSA